MKLQWVSPEGFIVAGLAKGDEPTDHSFTGTTTSGEAIFYDTGTFNLRGASKGRYTIDVYDFR